MSPPNFYGLSQDSRDKEKSNTRQNVYSENTAKRKDHINLKLAIKQWEHLLKLLTLLDVEVNIIPPNDKLRSLVFTCDNAFLYQNQALLANFKNAPRTGEPNYLKPYLKKMGYTITTCPWTLEGGDFRYCTYREVLWIGYGFRTGLQSINYLKQLPKPLPIIYGLKLIDPYFYHLDTCFCPFADGYALYYPQAFDQVSLNIIHTVYPSDHLIQVTREEALQFCCNAIYLPNDTIDEIKHNQGYLVANFFTSRLQTVIHNLNIHCISVNMSEFIKSGGSVHCCILERH